MEQEKQELVAKLYGLRGGLSVLSSIYDEAAAIKQHMETANKEIWRHCEAIADSREKMGDEKEYYDEKIERLKKEVEIAREKVSVCKKEIKVSIFATITGVLSLLLVVSFIWSQSTPETAPFFVPWGINLFELLLSPFSLISEKAMAIAGIVILVITGLISAFIILFVLPGFLFMGVGKEAIMMFVDATRWSNKLKERERQLSIMQDGKVQAKKSFEQEHEKRENAIKAKITPLEKQIAEGKQKMTVLIAEFQAVYKATQEQFGAVLDERDWGNVDLIIFNYETGRALDMRDALLQVDNERRNERLVKAVHEASEAISTTMRRGFGTLETAITKQLRTLDHRITSISEEMSGTVARIAENADRQSTALGRIADENAAQQALLSKINTSSDKMAADISALRQIASKTK